MRASVALFLASLMSTACASAPPSRPAPKTIATNVTTQAPLELPQSATQPSVDCPINKRAVPIGPDRVLRCRGIPFHVTFPENAEVIQEKVGPGTSFLGILKPAGAVAIAARPAIFETTTTNNPEKGLERTLDLIIVSLKDNNPQVDRRYDVTLGSSEIRGKALDFSYPLGSKKVAGSMRAFLIGGWVVTVLSGGPNDSRLYRGSAESIAFLDSLRVAPVDPTPLVVTFATGGQLKLPPDAWLNSDKRKNIGPNITRQRIFALPDLGTVLWLQEHNLGGGNCNQLMGEQVSREKLADVLRSSPNVEIMSLERRTIANAHAIFVDASVALNPDDAQHQGMPQLPAVTAMFCKDATLFMAITTGSRPRPELKATLESVLATYTSTPAPPSPSVKEIAQ